MRIFAILLLAVNILYLIWSLLFNEHDGSGNNLVRSASRQAPQTLQLLSETAREE